MRTSEILQEWARDRQERVIAKFSTRRDAPNLELGSVERVFWPPEPLYAQRRSMNLETPYTGERGSTASFPQPQFFCLDTLIRKSYGRATHSSSEAPVSKYVDVGYGGLVCSLANLIPAAADRSPGMVSALPSPTACRAVFERGTFRNNSHLFVLKGE